MPFTQDDILSVFPHLTLSFIIRGPTWPQLCQMQKELNANLAFVPSNHGDRKYSLLCLTMMSMAYAIVLSTPTNPPANPVAQPDPMAIASATSATKITQIHRCHGEDIKVYEECHATDYLLVRLICNAVDNDYIAAKKRSTPATPAPPLSAC